MDFLLIFLEGVASFISPCLLPMLPIYISYFIGKEGKTTKSTLMNAIGFVTGFTIVFLILSIFASKIGAVISSGMDYIQILFGIIIIILGLNYMELIRFKFLYKSNGIKTDTSNLNFIKSCLFGMIFSISWTPCIGIFLSSALLLVAKQQDIIKGILLMLTYSVGLGIPFILSVLLIEKLKSLFDFIKKNYNIIKKISGVILIIMGIYVIWF